MELVLRPDVAGIPVRLFVDASCGVHVDGISAARHTEVLNARDGRKSTRDGCNYIFQIYKYAFYTQIKLKYNHFKYKQHQLSIQSYLQVPSIDSVPRNLRN